MLIEDLEGHPLPARCSRHTVDLVGAGSCCWGLRFSLDVVGTPEVMFKWLSILPIMGAENERSGVGEPGCKLVQLKMLVLHNRRFPTCYFLARDSGYSKRRKWLEETVADQAFELFLN